MSQLEKGRQLIYTRRVCSAAESSWVVKVATTDDFASLADFHAYCSNIVLWTDKRSNAEAVRSLGRVKDVMAEDRNVTHVGNNLEQSNFASADPMAAVTTGVGEVSSISAGSVEGRPHLKSLGDVARVVTASVPIPN
jgi:hypothetical protein